MRNSPEFKLSGSERSEPFLKTIHYGIVMAKRVPFKQFAKQIVKHFDSNILSRSQIREFASLRGCTVPSEAWDNKIERGKYQINFSVTKTLDPISDEINVSETFEDLEGLVQVVGLDYQKSLVVTGSAGVGKTYTVEQQLNLAGLEEDRDYVVAKGKTSPFGLYLTLFLNHDKLIVFDDCDAVFKDEDSVNILKGALDTYSKRMISWNSKSTIPVSGQDNKSTKEYEDLVRTAFSEGDTTSFKLPNRFEFIGRIVFISNKHVSDIDSALLSRSLNIDITLSDRQVFERMELLLPDLLPDVPMEKKRTALDILKNAYISDSIERPNLRTMLNAIRVLSSNVKNSERLLKYV